MRLSLFLLYCLFLLPVGAQTPRSSILETGVYKKIDSVVLHDMKLAEAPGAMILVSREGQTLFEKPYGLRNSKTKDPVTPSTLFLTASVTKTITTAALLTVCHRKGISTEVEIGAILQGLPNDIAELSIHQILSQSSGLLDHWPGRKKWKADPMAYFSHFGDRLLSKELTGVFSYTNFGHVLAGMILSKLQGTSFEQAIDEVLLTPLGMDHTTYVVNGEDREDQSAAHRHGKVVPHEYIFPLIRASASMFSTAGDLSRFASCFMNKGLYGGIEVIPEQVVRIMSGLYTPVGVMHNYFGYPGSYYGYGLMSFEYDGVSFVGHPGETTTQNLLFAMAPDHKTSVVIMSNSGMFPLINTFEVLCETFLSSGTGHHNSEQINLPDDLSDFAGTYYTPSITGDRSRILEVYRKGKKLYLKLSEEEIYELNPLRPDLFSYVSPRLKFDVEIRFYRDENGQVKYLNHSWKSAKKIKT